VLERYFGIARAGSTVPRELRAGLTTFLTMSYVLFVNPQVLGSAIHVPGGFAKLLIVTALAAAVGSALMALVARYPFAQAPGMGLNAYFAYTVVLGQKVPWETALGAVLLVRRVPGAIVYGIVAATLLGIAAHAPLYPGGAHGALVPFAGLRDGVVALPVWPGGLIGALDVRGALALGAAAVVFTFFFVDFFDATGTLVGLASRAGYLGANGDMRRARAARSRRTASPRWPVRCSAPARRRRTSKAPPASRKAAARGSPRSPSQACSCSRCCCGHWPA
jgi:adenine/guanine/hypoxanthine permease